MAAVYSAVGESEQALSLYQQALPIRREVGDRSGEATTLNNIAEMYYSSGQMQKALELYEEVLPIMREVDDRAGEAATLNNIAAVYRDSGELEQALLLYEQALLIMREIGNRAGEAAILNGLAHLYQNLQRYGEARHHFEASIQLAREVCHPAYEATGLVGLANLLYRDLDSPSEAMACLEQAIALLTAHGLPQDADEHTVEQLQQALIMMKQDIASHEAQVVSTLPNEQVQRIIATTIAAVTVAPESQPAWHEQITTIRQNVQQQGPDWQIEVEFFTALLDLLEERVPTLPSTHPYAQAIAAIQQGCVAKNLGGMRWT
jgi:tetratricopeptide (TPR) repeat protein